MIIFKKIRDLQRYLRERKQKEVNIGFVPTMGALHYGHTSLINSSKKENGVTVCSIFVNPAQFNNQNDFEKYPITIEKDIYELEQQGCDILFLPSVEEIYPPGENADEHFDLGYLETILEGKFRPGHFQGVCKVMKRLLAVAEPDNLYMGQKDYQQSMIIKRLIELSNFNIHFHICPTLREKEGLAMSSRNLRLTAEEKNNASAIYQSLNLFKKDYKNKSFDELKATAKQLLTSYGFTKIDYIKIANADNLTLLNQWDGKTPLVGLIAAFMGDVRLIDNMILTNE